MLLIIQNLTTAGTAPTISILETPYCSTWNNGNVKWNLFGNVYTACWNRVKPTWNDAS